ncbi:DUF1304 family protein [Streptomyces sp. NPDC001393]
MSHRRRNPPRRPARNQGLYNGFLAAGLVWGCGTIGRCDSCPGPCRPAPLPQAIVPRPQLSPRPLGGRRPLAWFTCRAKSCCDVREVPARSLQRWPAGRRRRCR